MTDWFRSWHGAPTDAKWITIGRKAGVAPGIVSAVFWALCDYASQQEDRGNVAGFDPEIYADFSGFSEEDITAVLTALGNKRVIVDDRLVSWDRRQPKREDSSASRMRSHRERSQQPTGDEPPNDVTLGDARNDDVTQRDAENNTVTPEQRREEENRADQSKERANARSSARESIAVGIEPESADPTIPAEPPQDDPPPSAPPTGPKPRRSTASTLMPDGFDLSPDRQAYAVEHGISPQKVPKVWEAFVNHHDSHATRFVNWDAAWKTWVSREPQFDRGRSPTFGNSQQRTASGMIL